MLEGSEIGELSDLKKMCESLSRKRESEMFYEGGLILLEKCLLSNPSWVAVFIQIVDNKMFFDSAHPIGRNWINQSESAVTEAVWRLVRAIEPESKSWVLELVSKKSNFCQIVTLALSNKNRQECIKTLVQLSEDDTVREKISENLDDWLPNLNDSVGHRLVLKSVLIPLQFRVLNFAWRPLIINTVKSLLANFALLPKCRDLLKDRLHEIELQNSQSTINLYVNMAKNGSVRKRLGKCVKTTEKILNFFNQEKNIPQLLALVINLLLDENCFNKNKILEILKKYLLSSNKDIHNRSLAVAASLSSDKEGLRETLYTIIVKDL